MQANIIDGKRINHAIVIEKYAQVHKTTIEVAVKHALQGKEARQWKEAIVKEIDALLEHCIGIDLGATTQSFYLPINRLTLLAAQLVWLLHLGACRPMMARLAHQSNPVDG